MEEDIKVLEELKNVTVTFITDKERQAIENLIKGYKLEKLKNVLDEQSLKEALENYIPKSKIKEKIEELKQIKYSEEKCEKINNMYYKMIKQYDYEIAQFTIQILQELMEDK